MAKRKVSQEVCDAMVAAYLSGDSLKAAAARCDCSVSVIYDELNRRGIERRPAIQEKFRQSRTAPPEHQDAMVAAYLSGANATNAAAASGYTQRACLDALRRRGIEPRKDFSRITKEEKDAMVAAYLSGANADEAGALFGYSGSSVFDALKERDLPSRPAGPRETFSEKARLEVVALYRGGLTAVAIASQCGTSSGCVYRVLEVEGIERRESAGRPASTTPEEEEGILAFYLAGESCENAAQAFGYTEGVCSRILKERGIPARPLGKLSLESKDEVCRLYAQGVKATPIAKRFGVTQGGVLALLRVRGIERRNPSEANRKYQCNHDFFESIDTEEKAYWLGFLAADGCVSERNNVVTLTLQKKDAGHVDALRRALQSGHPLRESPNGGFPAVGLSVASPKMVADLAVHGIVPRKTFTMRWPAHLREELKRHFLRGYVDGDGCWTVNTPKARTQSGQLGFSIVGNEEFIREAQLYLATECGLRLTKLSRSHGEKVVSLHYKGNLQTARIAHLLYNGSSVCLGRKLDKARPYLLPETSLLIAVPLVVPARAQVG